MTKVDIVVCISPNYSAIEIIDSAILMARLTHKNLRVITFQPKITDAKNRAEDLKILYRISKKTKINIDVLYTTDYLKSFKSYISKTNPAYIFVDKARMYAKINDLYNMVKCE